jgi:3-methyl-2-oxobutanoate hydroxymethyltransferase
MAEELKTADDPDRKKTSVSSFVRMKSENRRIVMVTSYDYPTATIADAVGVDSILVGDSYGMVVLGYENTIPVTLEELLPVCRAVRRGAAHPLLIGDLPFMSFQVSPEEAIRTAGRFVKEGGMEAVKIEGGTEVSKIVESISRIGIPVLGHIGVTPQTATLHGGYRIQGRTVDSSDKLIADAKSLEEAGVFGIVLEMVTEEVAKVITETVSVPTIGIGSGRFCDGQVLVLHDLIGLYPSFTPKFAKRYADVAGTIKQALQNFTAEVRNGAFPEEQHVFRMDEDQRAKLDSKRKI